MNDFTKEELEDLNSIMHRHIYSCIDALRTNVLHKKIQYMIDNYCEHDFHPVLGQFQIESCHKCMKVK